MLKNDASATVSSEVLRIPELCAPERQVKGNADWRDVLQFAMSNFEGALAPNTLRAYRADIESYADFCGAVGLPPFPANDAGLVRFGEYLSNRQTFATIE